VDARLVGELRGYLLAHVGRRPQAT
jgi:hypothetical protein